MSLTSCMDRHNPSSTYLSTNLIQPVGFKRVSLNIHSVALNYMTFTRLNFIASQANESVSTH